MDEKKYYVYMLRCKDNSIYTGITTDIDRRIKEHFSKDKKCAKYTMHHPAKKLEAVWQTEGRKNASKMEFHIKKLSKENKELLVLNNNLEKILMGKLEIDVYLKINI